jgi:hypothetical protein
MRKLYGRWRRCIFCNYWTNKQYNLERHVVRRHTGDREMKYFTLMHNGVFSCRLHKVTLKYSTHRELRRHLYFCHRGDDCDFLIHNGLDPQKVEILCRDCKGSSYEYGLTRDDFWSYCQKNDQDGQMWEGFLKLNKYYEDTYIEEQFIIGQNLMAEYKKQCEGEHDPDDDDYKTKINAIKAAL